MPRRICDYPDAYWGWNYISSIGSMISILSIILFIYIIYDIFTTKNKAIANQWYFPEFFSYNNYSNINYNTLEWSTPSIPNLHTFEHTPLLLKFN